MLSPYEKTFRFLLGLVNVIGLFIKCDTLGSDLLVMLLYFEDMLLVYTIPYVVLNLFILQKENHVVGFIKLIQDYVFRFEFYWLQVV